LVAWAFVAFGVHVLHCPPRRVGQVDAEVAADTCDSSDRVLTEVEMVDIAP
jgi:hypothetical protein